jgi:toxin ParE1/3/4
MDRPFYTSAATQDLEDILSYIAKDKPNAAVAWVRQLESKCLLIATSPEIGEAKPQLGIGVRASVVGRYVIFHRQTNERVEILRVVAGDRDVTEL